MSSFEKLQESLSSCHAKLDNNAEILVTQGELIASQQEIIRTLQTENEALKQKIDDLSMQADDLEQCGRRNTLEIHGIPVADREVVSKVVLQTCQAVGVQIGAEEIDCCHRLKKRPDSRNPPPIIVKFVRRTIAHEIMQQKRSVNKLSIRRMGMQGETHPVYINLSLTAPRKILLSKVRKLQKEFGFKYVWVDKTSTIKIRIVENGRIYTVRCEKDLKAVPTTVNC
ncbi:uncharacterized protein LOC111058912 [Nilaparvata lugens]|uniref:uncharacterized protein LOC111058912 n=1 Tax=Nilaparvata lugens TaxID=108931 RepID=UPI00193CCA85|nr:uncharacterized protein LOC111058912 [Nilaparvata lugens]